MFRCKWEISVFKTYSAYLIGTQRGVNIHFAAFRPRLRKSDYAVIGWLLNRYIMVS